MYQHTRLTTSNFSFFQKFKNFDYILLFCILLLGFISLATMYSTDGGKVLFHTKSHFTKLIVFTIMMLIISFINIKYWFALGYISYLVVIGLLVWTYLFGITSSGSQRWINLYFINLQPSELMKIFIILCLARYFHRMKLENVNSIYTILTSYQIYSDLTQNNKIPLSKNFFIQFLLNINQETLLESIPDKEEYNYNDILELKFDDKILQINTPLGQSMSYYTNLYPITTNPFTTLVFNEDSKILSDLIKTNNK